MYKNDYFFKLTQDGEFFYWRKYWMKKPLIGLDVLLQSPITNAVQINGAGPSVTLTASYDQGTREITGTASLILNEVDLDEHYSGFWRSFNAGWSCSSKILISFTDYRGKTIARSKYTPLSSYTWSTHTAVPSTPVPSVSYKAVLPNANAVFDIKHVEITVLMTIAESVPPYCKRLYERTVLEKKINPSEFFSISGSTASLATLMTETDGLTLGVRVAKTFNMSGWKTVAKKHSSFIRRKKTVDLVDEFRIAGYEAAMVLSVSTPTLADDEVLICTLTPDGFSEDDFTSNTWYKEKSLRGIPGLPPHKAGFEDTTNEYGAFENCNRGHRSVAVVFLQKDKPYPYKFKDRLRKSSPFLPSIPVDPGYDSFDDSKFRSGLPKSEYSKWLSRVKKLKDPGSTGYYVIAGLKPAVTYTVRFHVARSDDDKVWEKDGKSMWVDYPISVRPDSGTIWTDGTTKTWASYSDPMPSDFWSVRAYRRMWLHPWIILDYTDTSTSARTPAYDPSARYALAYGCSVEVSDTDPSDPPVDVYFKWKSDKSKDSPDEWWIWITCPSISYDQIVKISGSDTSASPDPASDAVTSITYTRTDEGTYYQHSLKVSTSQGDYTRTISFSVLYSDGTYLYQ